jgi:hypothetical protein
MENNFGLLIAVTTVISKSQLEQISTGCTKNSVFFTLKQAVPAIIQALCLKWKETNSKT